MRGLKDKRIIVAGGATGMGAALARRLAEDGARILVGDVNATGLAELEADLQRDGFAIATHIFDLADGDSIDALADRAVSSFGGLDGLANTAADLSKATLGNDRQLMDMDLAVWERTLRVNLLGHALLMKAVIPHLKAAGGGSIVSVSSGAAHVGSPEMPAYSASKAGLQALVRHVARIAGKANIRCNIISPGLVITPGALANLTPESRERSVANIPLPRLGEPEDIASAIAFLLSDEATWITGQSWSVNGGSTFRD